MMNVNELRAKHDALVIEAADMIAEFNPAHAKVFAEESFRRIGNAKAFEAGFVKHSDYSRAVCKFVITAANLLVEYKKIIMELEEKA